MVKSAIKDIIQEAYRQYLNARDIKPRAGQRQMIAEIARYLSSIETDGDFKRTSPVQACVIEAGTGTGKTLAYLLATLPFASALKKNIVVSTATVTLQQQIMARELPLLKAHTGLDFSVALAKGRKRYLCLHKIDLHLQQQPQAALQLESGYGYNESSDKGINFDSKAYQRFLDWIVDEGWPGDYESLPEPVDDVLWEQVTTDHRQCLNKRCGYFSQCPYFRNKADIDQAELVVANHDLVFADLNLGGGFVLPPPQQTIYIFDEGHHVSDKALSHFAASAGLKSSQKLLRNVSKLLSDSQFSLLSDTEIKSHQSAFSSRMIPCNDVLEAIHSHLWETIPWGRDREQPTATYRYPMGILPDDFKGMAKQCASLVTELTSELDDLVKRLRELVDKERQGAANRQILEQALMQLASFLSQLENLGTVWRQMSNSHDGGTLPVARWLTTYGENKESEIIVQVSPTNVASLLQDRLWEKSFAVIMTSATMSVAGSFQRLITQTGIPEKSVYSIHQSPFNFAENCTLQLCDIGIEPSDRDDYLKPLAAGIRQLVKHQEATLVLFSSKRHMQSVAEALSESFPADFLLVQASNNKGQLLESHRRRIDKGEGSLIFGLASFAEGLDLPGNYLSHVIIAKLPFSVPDDPVEATYGEWLKSNGGNPFQQVVIPDATTRLLQACGRLLRSELDVGRISVFDRRLWTRSYGHTIMQALPPYRREMIKIESNFD